MFITSVWYSRNVVFYDCIVGKPLKIVADETIGWVWTLELDVEIRRWTG